VYKLIIKIATKPYPEDQQAKQNQDKGAIESNGTTYAINFFRMKEILQRGLRGTGAIIQATSGIADTN
jgi:hypothetical protein